MEKSFAAVLAGIDALTETHQASPDVLVLLKSARADVYDAGTKIAVRSDAALLDAVRAIFSASKVSGRSPAATAYWLADHLVEGSRQ